MMAVPCSFMRASTANSRSISRFSSAAVGSSRMKSRQRRRSALAMATSWRSAKLSDRTRAVGIGREIELRQSTARASLAHARAIDDREQAETRRTGRIAERDVLGDRQRRHQAQLLRDGDDAGGDGVVRAGEMAEPAVDRRSRRGRGDARRRGCGSASTCRRRSRRRGHGSRRSRRRNRRRRARASRRNACRSPRRVAGRIGSSASTRRRSATCIFSSVNLPRSMITSLSSVTVQSRIGTS